MICEAFHIGYDHSDKVDHAAVGLVIGSISEGLVEMLVPDAPRPVKIILGIVPAAVAGLAKEVYDAHHDGHDCDAWDFAATTAGGAAGALAVNLVWRF